ncbi:NIF3-like protein 1 [Patella vulgata]|uniref:NIF3-like protein 1 n=1 Tax=Patella vulgata TaxID=6465 RepID=UPI0024A9E3FC|nr:NIF3-like protein 1 [Patella vulgata]
MCSIPFRCGIYFGRYWETKYHHTAKQLAGNLHFSQNLPNFLIRTRQKHLLTNKLYKLTLSTNKKTVYHFSEMSSGMELGSVIKIIKQHAPTSLAESWDNVGLLVEPSSPHTVNTIMLTNDLTPLVLEESLEKKVDLILSYHPPIFSAVKRLSQGKWKDRLIIKCIENRIAVYSPHTCYDAKAGGVNDWLIGAFDTVDVVPVTNAEEIPGGYSHKVNILTKDLSKLQSTLSSLAVKQVSSPITTSSGEVMTVCSVLCNKCTLSEVVKAVEGSDCTVDTIENMKLEKIPVTGCGSGRYATLKQPLTPQEAVEAVKIHLNLPHVRLAAKPGQ